MNIKYSYKDIHKMVTKAYLDARNHERNKDTQLCFEMNLEENIRKISLDIYNRRLILKPLVCFVVFEPKPREVFAPQFRDRVVSHFLFNIIEPIFERHFIHDSYSCRKGKGTLSGSKRLESFIRKCTNNYKNACWVLELDINSYFVSVNKDILRSQIFRIIDNTPNDLDYDIVSYLIDLILQRDPQEDNIKISKPEDWESIPHTKSLFSKPRGIGLAIGDITSQLFSNIYLNDLDHFIKDKLKCKYYIRYVDDMRIVHDDIGELNIITAAINEFIGNYLGLSLNSKKTKIVSNRRNVKFLGACIRNYRFYACNHVINSYKKFVHNHPSEQDLKSFTGHFKNFKAYRIIHECSLKCI